MVANENRGAVRRFCWRRDRRFGGNFRRVIWIHGLAQQRASLYGWRDDDNGDDRAGSPGGGSCGPGGFAALSRDLSVALVWVYHVNRVRRQCVNVAQVLC